jgi:hypothetical protein
MRRNVKIRIESRQKTRFFCNLPKNDGFFGKTLPARSALAGRGGTGGKSGGAEISKRKFLKTLDFLQAFVIIKERMHCSGRNGAAIR